MPVYIATPSQLQMEFVFITLLSFTVVGTKVNIFYKHLLHKDCFASSNSIDICLSSIICPHQAQKKITSSSWQLKCQTQSIQPLGALLNCT